MSYVIYSPGISSDSGFNTSLEIRNEAIMTCEAMATAMSDAGFGNANVIVVIDSENGSNAVYKITEGWFVDNGFFG